MKTAITQKLKETISALIYAVFTTLKLEAQLVCTAGAVSNFGS